MDKKIILGIETSCDETAAAVVDSGTKIISNIVASQARLHATFGGIVPEVASRQHILAISTVINAAMSESGMEINDLDGIAVTYGPGLAGSLLVGLNAAKGLSFGSSVPLLPVNHLEGHVYATWLNESNKLEEIDFPLLCLIVSGGHTDLALMSAHGQFKLINRTRDDAAGEAFDKAARVLGLGYPGGPEIQKAAEKAKGTEKPFPRPKVKNSNDFSFSGLKTSLIQRAVDKRIYPREDDTCVDSELINEISFAFQEAVVDTLVDRTLKVASELSVKGIIVSGGVAANSCLRSRIEQKSPLPVVMPKPALCTDNGAMIASAGYFKFKELPLTKWDLDILPGLRIGEQGF